MVDSPNNAITNPTSKELVAYNSVSTKFQQFGVFMLTETDLGSLPHLTRQHWISLFSLILPGNDDDGCPRTSDPDLSVSLSWKY